MYQDYFGLRGLPFELTVDPAFLYLTPQHREALSVLEYGLAAAKPITVLIGEAGTGKTTLLQAALGSGQCRHVRCVHLSNPALTRAEFVSMLAARFELPAVAGRSKAELLNRLEGALRRQREAGGRSALVIDEAQGLSLELLEEVRLLANIESASEKLLPLVLVGQPELAQRLDEPTLRQLKQRIVLRCELATLTLAQTASYIAARLTAVGGVPARLFTREAVTLVHQRANGIPRTVNVICDNALLTAMAVGCPHVDSAIVNEVCDDAALRARPGAGGSPPPAPAQGRAEALAAAAPEPVSPAPEIPAAGERSRRFAGLLRLR